VTDFHSISFANEKFSNYLVDQDVNLFREPTSSLLEIFEGSEYIDFSKVTEQNFYTTLMALPPQKRLLSIKSNRAHDLFLVNIVQIEFDDKPLYLIDLINVTGFENEKTMLKKQIYIDGLTGVFNRNKFEDVATYEFEQAQKYSLPVAMSIFDIDHFKGINDRYGHLIGDEVLVRISSTVDAALSKSYFLARWGGEEFVIIFPNTTKEEALRYCEELRQKLEQLQHKNVDEAITVSFGVSLYQAGDTLESFFERCDEALYQAKALGRNRVEYR
jgi:diguanylate cyclase (GGDEF)-like protein